MHVDRRRARRLTVIVAATIVALIAAVLVILLAPRTPSATVTFNGYAVDAGGKLRAVFTITNTGRGTLRRWDFIRTETQEDGKVTRHHIGPDSMLESGKSEQIVIDVPSTRSPWKAAFQFSDYNFMEENAYVRGNQGAIHQLIWDLSVAVFESDHVDTKVTTDWIDPPDALPIGK